MAAVLTRELPGRQRPKELVRRNDRIIEDFNDGTNPAALAKQYNLSRQHIYAILAEARAAAKEA